MSFFLVIWSMVAMGDLACGDGAGVRGPLVSQHVAHFELRELAGHPGRNFGPKKIWI